MVRYIGAGLVVLGIYLLGQNIIFTNRSFVTPFQNVAAGTAVIAILNGIGLFLFGGRNRRYIALSSIIVGIVSIFVSGFIVVRSVSLWEFFLGFGSLIAGLFLLTENNFDLD